MLKEIKEKYRSMYEVYINETLELISNVWKEFFFANLLIILYTVCLILQAPLFVVLYHRIKTYFNQK